MAPHTTRSHPPTRRSRTDRIGSTDTCTPVAIPRRSAFIHVDGAVRAYNADAYTPTRANPQGERGDALRYRKLFRVDDAVEDDVWGRLVAHFFRGNELVIEYFGELLDERQSAAAPAA